MDRIDDPARVQRLARAVVSDVMLYHAQRVRDGLEHDDLFERLAPELEEAHEWFEQRVCAATARKTNAWGRALVDVLVYRSARVATRIW